MSRQRQLYLSALILAGLPAFATDGYFAMGYGTASKGMGGSGAALPLDALSSASNPASLAFLGNRFDMGVAWFNPSRSYEVKGAPSGYPNTFPLTPGTVDSDSEHFIIPSLGVNWQLTEKSSFGIAVYGNGGMNTDYNASVFYGGDAGVDLSQLFIAPTYSYRYSERHAFGLSAVIAYQKFEAKGLSMFSGYSSDPSHLTNKGEDTSTGVGLRIGYLGRLTPQFSVGASYQTRTNMSEFDKYDGLFAEKGGFDIPSNYTVGIAFHPTETLTFAFDVERIHYSEVNSINNPLLPNLMTSQLGNSNGAGFGWDDVTVYKVGVQWNATPDLTVRAGYNHCEQPIPESEVLFNILAPGVVEDHITVGATLAINARSSVSISVVRALSNEVTGSNPMEAPGAQTITLEMDQWDVEIGYSHTF
jgi:long-chain fatty acid transport protein